MKSMICIAFLTVALLPAIAGAQDDPHNADTSAEGHYQTAVRLYGEGRYREALDEFDAAITIAPQAVFFCNRALPLIKLQETGAALQSLEECLSKFEGTPEERAQIDAQMRGVAAYHRHVRISSQVVSRDIATGPVSIAPQPRVEPGWNKQDWGLITAGAGVALLGSALVLDLTSKSLKDDFIAESDGGEPDRYAELESSLQTRQLWFWILGGTGTVAVLTGVTMILWPSSESEPTGWRFTPIVGSDSVGASGTLTW